MPDQSTPLVTVGVPVYRGQDVLPVTLECMRTQSYGNLDVLISVDGTDEASIEASRPFLNDRRFRLHVQPARLGWAGNLNWTLQHRQGDFFIFQQHDDQVSPTYIADLVAAALQWPKASVCYSEMKITGHVDAMVRHKAILGDPISRALTHIERFDTSMLRGLIRSSALDRTGGVQTLDHESFGSDHRFMTELALAGEFRFVSGPTYFKRLHDANLHLKWYEWTEEKKRAAWTSLAAQIVEALVPAGRDRIERWHLLYTALERFIVSRGGDRWSLCTMDDADDEACLSLLAGIFRRVRDVSRIDIPSSLGASWPEIAARAAMRFERHPA